MSEKPFWKSKKWIVAFVSAAVPALNAVFGWGIPLETVLMIIGPLGTYVLGQGLADLGKNRG